MSEQLFSQQLRTSQQQGQGFEMQFTREETWELGKLNGIPDLLETVHTGLSVYGEVRGWAKANGIMIPPPRLIFIIAGESGVGKATMAGQLNHVLFHEENDLSATIRLLQLDGMQTESRYSSLSTVRNIQTQAGVASNGLAFTPESSRAGSLLLGERLLQQLHEPAADRMVVELREAVLIPKPTDDSQFDLGITGITMYADAIHQANEDAISELAERFSELDAETLMHLLPYKLYGIGLLDGTDKPVYLIANESRHALAATGDTSPEKILKQFGTRIRSASNPTGYREITSRGVVSNSGGPETPLRGRMLTNAAIARNYADKSTGAWVWLDETYERRYDEIMRQLATDPVFRERQVTTLLEEVFGRIGIPPSDQVISVNNISDNPLGVAYHHASLKDIERLP